MDDGIAVFVFIFGGMALLIGAIVFYATNPGLAVALGLLLVVVLLLIGRRESLKDQKRTGSN